MSFEFRTSCVCASSGLSGSSKQRSRRMLYTTFLSTALPVIGMRLAAPRASYPKAFICAVTMPFHLHTLCVLPFWCGGLCAAHPPPPEGRAERARSKSFHPSVPSSNLYASKLSLRFLATGPTPILIFPSPGPAQTAALRPQFAFAA